ncbi:dihydroxyacetone kinase subunit L [Thalassospira lucentensis]|uniref:Dak phosphatase n=1 Tax=Thalassospira lucentensis TaxID=168935 RepID=A0A358HRX4_9PROT|nr:dihydroxyacetone kinase subunit L [Thalassospira lucentensis]HBU97910.1 Dak phosphatase [Thalassospira lucentensis]HCW69095.1 Dak phosphatase [Thalassospira lucentensis]|tara:strand:- start:1733 stop:2368 length:636 start_codon:yes stop_codon:yes gene_type:complete
MDTINTGHIAALFEAFHATFRDKRDELIALDAKVGDSDLGITMNSAFEAASNTVSGMTNEPLGKQFKMAGAAMAKAAPSTMGTLTATGFMRGGKAVDDADTIGTGEMAAFWRAYTDGIAERGKAKLGDKTVLDVLEPIAKSLESSTDQSVPLVDAVVAASNAGQAALEATKDLVAQHGKAAAFADKSKGLQDAGGTVAFLLIETIARFVKG